MFGSGQRLEHVITGDCGTVVSDDGDKVQVQWDNTRSGWLLYDRSVMNSAYRLLPLAQKIDV